MNSEDSGNVTDLKSKIALVLNLVLVVQSKALPVRWRQTWARFSNAQETFRAREAISSSSVSKNRGVYASETSAMKGTSVHIKNMWIKQLWNHKVWDFAMAPGAKTFRDLQETHWLSYTTMFQRLLLLSPTSQAAVEFYSLSLILHYTRGAKTT